MKNYIDVEELFKLADDEAQMHYVEEQMDDCEKTRGNAECSDDNPRLVLYEYIYEIDALEDVGRLSEALNVCDAALEAFPENLDLVRRYIEIAWKAGHYDQVHRGIDFLKIQNPGEWTLKVSCLVIKALVGEQLPGSVAQANRFIELRKPFHPCEESFYLEYVLQSTLGNRNSCEILQAVVDNSNAPVCSYALAREMIDQRKLNKAREIILKAIAFSGKNCDRLLFLLVRTEDARVWLDLDEGMVPEEHEVVRVMRMYMELRNHLAFADEDEAILAELDHRHELLRMFRNGFYDGSKEKGGEDDDLSEM